MRRRFVPSRASFHDGRYLQTFGPEKQALVACDPPISARPAGTMFEEGDFARPTSRGVRRDRSVPFPTRAPAAPFLPPPQSGGSGRTVRPCLAFRARPRRLGALTTPGGGSMPPAPFCHLEGSGRRRPDEREPRVDDIDASPSRSAMSRGGGLVVPRSGSAAAEAQAVCVGAMR